MLTTRWGRRTHYAPFGSFAQTAAASQMTKHALRACPPRRSAPRHPQGARPDGSSALLCPACRMRRSRPLSFAKLRTGAGLLVGPTVHRLDLLRTPPAGHKRDVGAGGRAPCWRRRRAGKDRFAPRRARGWRACLSPERASCAATCPGRAPQSSPAEGGTANIETRTTATTSRAPRCPRQSAQDISTQSTARRATNPAYKSA